MPTEQDKLPDPIVDSDSRDEGETPDEEILEEANERFRDVCDRDRENREAAVKDTKFVYIAGQQWPSDWKHKRALADDPCLEFPQLKQFVNQVVNEQRQSRPGIRIHPAAGQSSKDVATILQGLIRHIEYESGAEAAYDGGFQHAVVGGRGYWRVISEYDTGKTFNQRLSIKRIPDPSTVYMDPDFQEPDGSDSRFCFVTDHMSHEDFEAAYPDAEPLSWQPSDQTQNWYMARDEVVVADYYRRVCKKRQLVAMSDGSIGWKDEMPAGIKLPPGVSILAEREAEDYAVEWYTLAGGEQILEKHDCPGTLVPVICCMGDEIMVDGKRIFQGLIRQAKDAQMMYNAMQSAKVLYLFMASRAPYQGPAAAIEGYEDIWKSANTRNYSYLPTNEKDADGNPIPQPQRTMPPQVGTGWVEASQAAKEDLKSVIGMYQASLGMAGQEVSGRAITAREKQSDNATFHFADNLARAIALTGRIILGMIPTIYDTKRLITIVGTDDARSDVMVNNPQPDPNDPFRAIIENDLTTGQYSVTVESGPNYATKRAEAADSMLQLVQSYPPVMQLAGDIVVGNMDFADSDKLAERLKAGLPPQIQQMIAQEEAQGKPGQSGQQPPQQPQIPPEMMQQMQQMQQEFQQLQQENQQLKSGTMQKQQAAEMDASIKERTAVLDADVRKFIAELTSRTTLQAKAMDIEAQFILKGAEQAAQPEPVVAEADQMAQGAEQQPALADVMAMVGQLADKVGKMSSAKRQHKFIMDGQGNIIGGESTLVGPDTVQ